MTDYNLDADKEAKEKMVREMCEDAGINLYWLPGTYQEQVFDNLIRKGWRKVNHISDAGKMV